MAKYSPPKGYYWTLSSEYREGYGKDYYVLELRKKFWGFLPGKTVHSRYLTAVGSSESVIKESVDRVAPSILTEVAR